MSSPARKLYRFGPFRLDPVRRLLWQSDEPLPLTAKAFDLLLVLVEHSGQLLDKEELMNTVWRDALVEENNLTVNMSALRKALGDSPEAHRYIITVPGRGYRFVAAVEELADGGVDLVAEKDRRSRIPIEEKINGHANAESGLRIADPASAIVERRRRRAGWGKLLLVGAILAIGFAAVALALREFIQPGRTEKLPVALFHKPKITELTETGRQGADGAISSDGRYIAYIRVEAGRESLWIIQVDASSSQPLIPPAEARYFTLSFSRDGNYLYYVRLETRNSVFALYRIPLLGGVPKKLLADVAEAHVTLSPDEERAAFVRQDRSRGESVLMIAALDGSGQQQLASRSLADPYQFPAWSPDGQVIACSTGTADSGSARMGVVAVRVGDGSEIPVGAQRWGWVGRKAWLADGSGLALITCGPNSGCPIRLLSYPEGKTQQTIDDPGGYRSLSLTADARTLLAVRVNRISDIWTAPAGDAARARRLAAAQGGLAWAPDGRIVYAAYASGSEGIWIMNADGTEPKQLTAGGASNRAPAVSPNGRYIAFMSNATGPWHIWRMEMDGSNPVQLTNGGGKQEPCFTRDGQWVVYTSVSDWTLWKVPVEGGDPVRLTDGDSRYAAVSPDGRWLAYLTFTQYKLVVIPSEGGPPVKVLNLRHKSLTSWHVRWTPDGQALAYAARDGVGNLWAQRLDGDPPEQLTHFTDDGIFNFAWSPDGRQLACTRGTWTHDLVLISDSK